MAARICPHCRTRVDERRARQSPYCLTCGCVLGAPPPFMTGKSAASRTPLPWILGGLGALAVLGLGAAAVVVLAFSGGRETKPTAQVESTNLPAIETAQTPTPTPPPTFAPPVRSKPTSRPTAVAPTATPAAKPSGLTDPFGPRGRPGF